MYLQIYDYQCGYTQGELFLVSILNHAALYLTMNVASYLASVCRELRYTMEKYGCKYVYICVCVCVCMCTIKYSWKKRWFQLSSALSTWEFSNIEMSIYFEISKTIQILYVNLNIINVNPNVKYNLAWCIFFKEQY